MKGEATTLPPSGPAIAELVYPVVSFVTSYPDTCKGT